MNMMIKHHFIFGLTVSLLLTPVYGANVLIIFFANILIDVDHYIYYIYKFKSLDILKARDYFMEDHKSPLLLLHTSEFLLALLLVSFHYRPAFFVLVGVLAHFMMDVYGELGMKNGRKFPSIILYLVRIWKES